MIEKLTKIFKQRNHSDTIDIKQKNIFQAVQIYNIVVLITLITVL